MFFLLGGGGITNPVPHWPFYLTDAKLFESMINIPASETSPLPSSAESQVSQQIIFQFLFF